MIKPKKLIVASVIVVLAALSAMIVAFASDNGLVTADLLNVRREADKESEVIIKLSQGAEVRVIDMKGDWYQIAFKDVTGWVVTEYLKVDFEVIQVAGDDVNVRKGPGTDELVVGKVQRYERYIVLDRFVDWFKIKLPSGENGWINDQFAKIVGISYRGVMDGVDVSSQSTVMGSISEPARPTEKMEINGNNVNFRDNPDLEAEIKLSLEKDTVVTVIEKLGEWRKIRLPDGQVGYVNKMFLKEIRPEQVAVADTTTTKSGGSSGASKTKTARTTETNVKAGSGSSAVGSDLISFARQFMGIRYKWGGTTPSGFDCSGFTSYVMRQFGVSIPRTSRDQSRSGSEVSKSNLRTGDLVFFGRSSSNRTVSHVGIYIGDGNFIHSSSGGGGKGVTISNLNSGSYAARYVGARRYLK
ncbi:MAG: SH3 domain-containing protein [Oscillospiraceae bacterium]|nr:SH3 domain-containing protein [Oscillospiraceae bacterium]